MTIDGLLLDIDGVLAVSWEPLPGAVKTISRFREEGPPFRLVTNTTTKTRADLGATLRDAGFDFADEEIITAVVATAGYLRAAHPGQRAFVLSDGDAKADLGDIELVDVEQADVIVLGGAYEGFAYPVMNEIFRRLMDGAALVGMHRNMYWKTDQGWELDAGAYLAGLEEASGVTATICGKPEPAYFDAALRLLGTTSDRTAMVGDDVVNDVLGAQSVGLIGVLVRTGKYRPGDEERNETGPDHVVGSIADVPDLVASG